MASKAGESGTRAAPEGHGGPASMPSADGSRQNGKNAHTEIDGASGGAGFVESASAHLRAAQAALTDLLAEAGLGDAKPTQIGRSLGLDKTLAWKVARFVQNPDPALAVRHMPGVGGVEIFIKAAIEQGVSNDRIEAVRTSDAELREFVKRHAGDRRSFEAMLASGEQDTRGAFEDRREFFRAGAVLWGVRAKAQLLTLILKPSADDPSRLDVIQVGGLVHLERLRTDVPWLVRRLRVFDDHGKSIKPTNRTPLDPAGAGSHGLALVPEFCSRPLPELRQFEDDHGWIYNEIAPGEVGRKAAVTCITGEVYRNAVPAHHGPDNTRARYSLTVRTPVEVVILDILIHRDISQFSAPSMEVMGLLEDRPRSSPTGAHASPLQSPSPAQELGSPPATATPRVPLVSKLAPAALRRSGWGELKDYRGYRAEVVYPVSPCEVALTCQIRPPAD